MAYTVKQFSELSKVSPRTLRFYEEMGLFSPAYYGENGYRYYRMEQLIALQEIVLLKELGFSLQEIKHKQTAISSLRKKQKALTATIQKLQAQVDAIDPIIHHLERKNSMQKKIFDSVDIVKKGNESAPFFLAEETVLQSCLQTEDSSAKIALDLQQRSEEFLKEIAIRMQAKDLPESASIQKLLASYMEIVAKKHKLSKEVCLSFATLYRIHPIFHGQLKKIDPMLPDFLANSMEIFAEIHF